jgi:hypothetical protein
MNENLTKFAEYVENLVTEYDRFFKTNNEKGQTIIYDKGIVTTLNEAERFVIKPLFVTNLQSIIDYCNNNLDNVKADNSFIQIISSSCVELVSKIDERYERVSYIVSEVEKISWPLSLSQKDFHTYLKNYFDESPDLYELLIDTTTLKEIKEVVIQNTGNSDSVNVGYSITNAISERTGKAKVIKNQYFLKPQITFPEIIIEPIPCYLEIKKTPSSEFNFRIDYKISPSAENFIRMQIKQFLANSLGNWPIIG